MGIHAERTRRLRELSLFSGAGGGLLASQYLKGWQTVCYVEWDKYCQQVIQARIRDGLLHDAPIWDNVNTFDGSPWRGLVDVISAGFPCQPFSELGQRKSTDDPRNGWPSTIRIIREVQPGYVFLENVRGLLSAVDKSADEPIPYFGTILRDLSESGYDARWRLLSAAECGAPHKRDRVWIVANANGSRFQKNNTENWLCTEATDQRHSGQLAAMGDAAVWSDTCPDGAFPMGVGNGVANGVGRLKAAGNGQVPIVAATAWNMLTR